MREKKRKKLKPIKLNELLSIRFLLEVPEFVSTDWPLQIVSTNVPNWAKVFAYIHIYEKILNIILIMITKKNRSQIFATFWF